MIETITEDGTRLIQSLVY